MAESEMAPTNVVPAAQEQQPEVVPGSDARRFKPKRRQGRQSGGDERAVQAPEAVKVNVIEPAPALPVSPEKFPGDIKEHRMVRVEHTRPGGMFAPTGDAPPTQMQPYAAVSPRMSRQTEEELEAGRRALVKAAASNPRG